jgi:ATP-dependent helicase/nuclease subunit A
MMDKHFLSDDQAARTDALDVTRSFIIQAPAGSGKTELLIQRFLSLLAVVDNPEEVIAITFTRKAAAEMQLRVLAALNLARGGTEPHEEHQRTTFKLASAALEKSDTLQWNVIGNPRRLRILTLDALNASIARSQLLRENGTGSRIVVAAELLAVNQAAAIATLDYLADDGHLRAATVEVLQHVDNNTRLYVSYLSQMLATRDQWLPFIGSGQLSDIDAEVLRQRFEESLELAVTGHLQRAFTGLSRVDYVDLPGLLDYGANKLVEGGAAMDSVSSLVGLTKLPAANPEAMQQWKGIAELLLTQKGEFRKQVDKRQGFPTDDKAKKLAMKALLAAMAADADLAATLHGITSLPPVSYSDEQWRVLLALFRILPLAVIELNRLFSERGIADHVDVAISAASALGTPEAPGDIALLLDYQIKHMLVDEMQDTSASQYRMLETLVGGWQPGDGRSLCCVGDPMQSIYRFRNAEVGQFLLAQEFGIGQVQLEPLLLRRNFRSGEQLVDWFNAVFPSILAAEDDPLRSAVSYSNAISVPQQQGKGACIVHPLFTADKNFEAAAGAEVIARVLNENCDDDMAVLVRGRTQLPHLLANLRDAGIPYRAIEIDRLTDLPEVIDVLALTRAAAHLGDRIAWLGLLRCAWIGLDWADLHALVRNDTKSTVWRLLQDQERIRNLSVEGQAALARVSEPLRRLTAPRRVTSLRDLIEQTWFALGGPGLPNDAYAIDNVYRFFDVLGGLERAGTIVDVGELESILDLERVSSNDNARLQIMTMHRAKGLQFDHVLLYGLGRQPGTGERAVLSWFDLPASHGVERKVISPVGPRATIENDAVHRYIELSETDKDRHEQGRLLYVACTRARKSLHLMGHTTVAQDGESFKAARSNSLLSLLWTSVEPDFASMFQVRDQSAAEETADVWVKPVLRRFEQPWSLPEARLLAGDNADQDVQSSDNEVEFYWVGSDARIAGTIVHRWMQLLADTKHTDSIDDMQSFRAITSRWLKENGVDDGSANTIMQRVEEAVVATLNDAKGRWILNGEGHAELALTGIHEDELVAVILDRVRIDDDGTHWIIDYKTSSHEGGNLQGFLQVESDRYKPQLKKYASIYSNWAGVEVKCALYFPLLTSFIEVALDA